jgi:Flp pilus assembly secretin CpaC
MSASVNLTKTFNMAAVLGGAVLAAIVAAGPVRAENGPIGPTLNVTLDQAKVARVADGTKTLVIGNPIVADVYLLKGNNTMVVTGKGFGETNLIELDAAGNVLDEKMIRVEPTTALLVVQRGMNRESYSCAPTCMPSFQLGDDGDQFGTASSQITQRNSMTTPQSK